MSRLSSLQRQSKALSIIQGLCKHIPSHQFRDLHNGCSYQSCNKQVHPDHQDRRTAQARAEWFARNHAHIIQELEFLADLSLLTASQLDEIFRLIPQPNPATQTTTAVPVAQLAAVSNAQRQQPYQPSPSPQPVQQAAPPVYTPSQPTSIATATSLYVYNPTDAGDLALLPNDRVSITEYMNVDWAKGRNERTGLEGIFPRSYIKVADEKSAGGIHQTPPPPIAVVNNSSGYGNMPLEVSQQGGGPANGQPPNKNQEGGKKFGKKLGNAGEFSADCHRV
jgi:hypothetical protein